jgi:hypothetical protein
VKFFGMVKRQNPHTLPWENSNQDKGEQGGFKIA